MKRYTVGTWCTAALVSAAVIVGCTPDAPRDSEGAIAEGGSMSAFEMRVGDCLREQAQAPADEIVSDVPVVPCPEPHDGEVFALFDLGGSEWPGETVVFEQADVGCMDRFAGYVARDYQSSRYYIRHLSPTQDSWSRLGDREVVCVLYDPAGATMTGSARASGL